MLKTEEFQLKVIDEMFLSEKIIINPDSGVIFNFYLILFVRKTNMLEQDMRA